MERLDNYDTLWINLSGIQISFKKRYIGTKQSICVSKDTNDKSYTSANHLKPPTCRLYIRNTYPITPKTMHPGECPFVAMYWVGGVKLYISI